MVTREHKLMITLLVLLCFVLNTTFCSSAREFPVITAEAEKDEFVAKRDEMVKLQIEKRGIEDELTLKAMKAVKRHYFVPLSLQEKAYADRPLPIGYGQTISQPYIVAYMTQFLKLKKNMKVLEIGTGSGYQAAVLAEIADKVFTVEIVPELGSSAAERLKKLGYDKVKVKVADGYHGWKKFAPFDAIIVTAASGNIPPPLLEQLANNGKMIIPVGSPFQVQMLVLVEKINGKAEAKRLLPVRFVPFTRSEE